jgi:hypothetical protein
MKKIVCKKLRTLSAALGAVTALAPFGASAAGTTSASVGVDYVSGDYGTAETTSTFTIPVSVKHENGPWTFRGSVPLVRAEGTFNRELGIDIEEDRGRGRDGVGATVTTVAKRTESGLGDLTVSAFYNLLSNPGGYGVDIGGKAKLALFNKSKSLITSGENDYSVQVDVYRALTGSAASVFASLGYTLKGEPAGANYKNPLYSSLGFSVPLAAGSSIGAAWDYRQKITTNGDPINEISGFYTMKTGASNKMQFYLVHGFSNGSPDFGGGVVLTHSY